jgi:hypothetical protein
MQGFLDFTNKHAVAGSSGLKATTTGHIFNIRVTSEQLDNGTIVGKGALEEGTIETYTQAAASSTFEALVESQAANGNYYVAIKAVDDNDVLILSTPETPIDYTADMRDENTFYNVKDDVARGYSLHVNDLFELSIEGFIGEIQVGDTVVVDADTSKLVKKA